MLLCLGGVRVLLLEAQFGLMCLIFLGDLQREEEGGGWGPLFLRLTLLSALAGYL